MKRQCSEVVRPFAEVARQVRVWRELAGSQTVQPDYKSPTFVPRESLSRFPHGKQAPELPSTGPRAGFNMCQHIARCTFGGPKYFEPPESRSRNGFGSGAVLPSQTSKPMPLCKTTSRSAMRRDGKSLPIPGRIVTTLS